MSAQFLYHMFKSKTKYPLHSAVRLRREDVVFLYVVEHSSQVCTNDINLFHSKMSGSLTMMKHSTHVWQLNVFISDIFEVVCFFIKC